MPASGDSYSDDDDPVVASFDVLLKPALRDDQSLYILQYPTRATENPADLRSPDLESLRVKPKTGMVEVDVPLNYNVNYDKKKGIAWGTALKKSMEGKGPSGSLGIAGGFGVNSAPARRGRAGAAATEGSDQTVWAEAVRTNNVLSTQTLGGMNIPENNARYAVAVFQGNALHLTPVENLVHLRPTLHHLDAMTEQERAARPPPPGPATTGKDAGGAKAIHMTIKSAMGEDEVIETMKDRLKAVQQEKWKRFEYMHDESEAAWEAYNEALFVEGTSGGVKADDDTVMQDADSGAAKGKAVAAAADPSAIGEDVEHLQGTWDEYELLRVVGGMDEDEEELTAAAENLNIKGKVKEERIDPKADKDDGAKRRPGRPPKNAAGGSGTASQAAPRKASKGKGRATVEID